MQHLLQSLLNAGANPNPRRVAETPVQAAGCGVHAEVDIARHLLEADAAGNAVRDEEAVIRFLNHSGRHQEEPDKALKKYIHNRGECHFFAALLRIVEETKIAPGVEEAESAHVDL